jgi:hypothetical protein
MPDGGGDQGCCCAQPLVVGRRGGQVGKQVAHTVVGEPQPAPLGVAAQQDLGHRQADQLGVGQLGGTAWSSAGAEQVVDGDVQCGDEGVEIGVHAASMVDVASATPTLGTLNTSSHLPANLEAVIQ